MSLEHLDPWGHAMVRDYERLFKTFGIKPFKPLLSRIRNPMHLMRRGVVFGHRDYESVLDALENGDRPAIVTGFMPSGRFHFGHKMIADQLIYYQRLGFELFVPLADAEAYAVRKIPRSMVVDYALNQYVANLIALGLEKRHLHIYFQTNYEVPYYRLLQMSSRRVTGNEMEAIYGSLEPGKIVAALTQVADILHPQLEYFGGYRHVLVPVGVDQDPHIRLTRDIADRMSEIKLTRPASTYHRFMTGLDGGKMSSSRPDYAIFLDDPVEDAVRKLRRALTGGRPTVEEQRKLGGEPEKCTVYEFYLYHLVLDDAKLLELYRRCREGEMLCGECKRIASEMLASWLREHHRRLEKARDRVLEYVEPPSF